MFTVQSNVWKEPYILTEYVFFHYLTFSISVTGPSALIGDTFLAVRSHASKFRTLADVADVSCPDVTFHTCTRFISWYTLS